MTKINLCSPLNYSWGKLEPCVPLGVLSLAAVARSCDCTVQIKDINSLCSDARSLGDIGFLADHIVENDPDIIVFSSICNIYPTTIQLAAACKRLRPEALIIFGGPQASDTATETLHFSPAVDAVIVGEGETAFKEFLMVFSQKLKWTDVPSLAWRYGSDVVQNELAPLLADLYSLPMPAYDLNPLSLSDVKSIPIEAGRGC